MPVPGLSSLRWTSAAPCVALAFLLCSCSETLRLKSAPSGASIYINDKHVGETPVTFATSTGDRMRGPWRYRVTYRDAAIGSGEIETRVSRGRIWGAVFTAGILMVFRSPRVFVADEIVFKFVPPTETPPGYFSQVGTGSIVGQAFAVTRGGDVKPAAGRTVALHPDTAAIRAYYAPLATDTKYARLLALPPSESLTKTTTADATGSFQFDELAPGRYFAVTSVDWVHFAGFNYTRLGAFGWVDLQWATAGGVMAQGVEVKEGRPSKVIMTPASAAGSVGSESKN